MEIIIIGLCLWAIALEWELRKRGKTARIVADAIHKVAAGEMVIVKEGDKSAFKKINKEK
jgi:hypothetical protein